MMNTLYYAPGACSLSVHIVLEWLGEPYETVRVNPADPEYHKLNPPGQVPALDIGDGTLLTHCSAILAYLAHTHPDANGAVQNHQKDYQKVTVPAGFRRISRTVASNSHRKKTAKPAA